MNIAFRIKFEGKTQIKRDREGNESGGDPVVFTKEYDDGFTRERAIERVRAFSYSQGAVGPAIVTVNDDAPEVIA